MSLSHRLLASRHVWQYIAKYSSKQLRLHLKICQTKFVPLRSCTTFFYQGQSVPDFSFLMHIKRIMLNKSVALESKWSPRAPDDRAPTPDTEMPKLPVFVCRTLWNMWFQLQNVLLLNNVSALELSTLHKGYFVP